MKLKEKDMNKIDEFDKQVWIKHRELEIAIWEEHIAHNKLSDNDKKVYEDAIKDSKKLLSIGR